jgi:SAM-dependent methyltransferase
MPTPIDQHQTEIQRNRTAWQRKPLLRAVYSSFYHRLRPLLDPTLPGRILELGSGIGNFRDHVPGTLCTDLFPNPWLDLACDGYELPFRNATLSHLLIIDVFHHLEAPRAFLDEARRVLVPHGRLIILDPYISWFSFPIYGLLHHEPVGWRKPIRTDASWPRPRPYYAAQGNATRLFFAQPQPAWLKDWNILVSEAFSSLAYLCSGGFSRPSLAPLQLLPALFRLDAQLTRWPRLFAVRCLVCLETCPSDAAP